MQQPHLLTGVLHKKLELLVPHGRPVAARVAGGILLSAPEGLRSHLDAAVGVALPGEAPHRQIAGLQQGHLRRQPVMLPVPPS